MARMYDVLTGRRFDMNHESWKLHMVNKDGSIKSRMDYKLADKLVEQGIIELVPSVTEVAEVGNGFGVFKFAAAWGMEIGVQATMNTWGGELASTWEDRALALAKQIMDAPKDKGSELHDLFHRMETGQVKEPTAEETKFWEVCSGVIMELGIMAPFRTEVEFACSRYGGTCDLDAFSRGLDWKTVKEFRQPRISELLQIAAYADHFGWTEAFIVYIRQHDFARKILRLGTKELALGMTAFNTALTLWGELQPLEGIRV